MIDSCTKPYKVKIFHQTFQGIANDIVCDIRIEFCSILHLP